MPSLDPVPLALSPSPILILIYPDRLVGDLQGYPLRPLPVGWQVSLLRLLRHPKALNYQEILHSGFQMKETEEHCSKG